MEDNLIQIWIENGIVCLEQIGMEILLTRTMDVERCWAVLLGDGTYEEYE